MTRLVIAGRHRVVLPRVVLSRFKPDRAGTPTLKVWFDDGSDLELSGAAADDLDAQMLVATDRLPAEWAVCSGFRIALRHVVGWSLSGERDGRERVIDVRLDDNSQILDRGEVAVQMDAALRAAFEHAATAWPADPWAKGEPR